MPLVVLVVVVPLCLEFAGCLLPVTLVAGWASNSDEVLSASALRAFEVELPVRLHGLARKLVRPLANWIPSAVARPAHLIAVRRDLAAECSECVHVEEEDARSPYRHWRTILHESCFILGYITGDEPPSAIGAGAWSPGMGKLEEHPACPDLWVDEGWPPNKNAPAVDGRLIPVWSIPGTLMVHPGAGRVGLRDGQGERGLLVLQAKLLQEFPEAELKALIGHELGKAAWAVTSLQMPGAWTKYLSHIYVLGRIAIQARAASARPPELTVIERLGGLVGGAADAVRRQGQQSLLGNLGSPRLPDNSFFGGPAAPLTEWMAFDLVMKRAVPFFFRPFIYGVVLSKGGPRAAFGPLAGAGRAVPGQSAASGATAPPARRFAFGAVASKAPWLQWVGEAGALRVLGLITATHTRSVVVTADRAAAVVAGDANVAATALLRAHGLLLKETEKEVLESIAAMRAKAGQRSFSDKRDTLLRGDAEPPIEVRVKELMKWSDSAVARRLIALGELRRAQYKPPRLSLWASMPKVNFDFSQEELSSWIGRCFLAVVLLMPLVFEVDLIRWSAVCTIFVTVCGMLTPVLPLMDGHQRLLGLVIAPLFVAYGAMIWPIWWNHLLGGSRHWARLSCKLTSQLADQADMTAGIAYLTRDWAEMAKRSLQVLDQELRGSWRTNLSELASKLADMRNELPTNDPQPEMTMPSRKALPFGSGLAYADSSQSAIVPVRSRAVRSSRGGGGRRGFAGDGAFGDDPSQLWVRLDRAVRCTLAVEVERMRGAVASNDPQGLQAAMAWWTSDSTAILRAANSAISSAMSTQSPDDSLVHMLVNDQVHQRFPYQSFLRQEQDVEDDSAPDADEFSRLGSALASNFQELERLRSRLVPMADPSGHRRCVRWSDVRRISTEMYQKLLMQPFAPPAHHDKDGSDSEIMEDDVAERRILSSLLAAGMSGMVGVLALARVGAWWLSATAVGFSAANMILVLNYWRLSLPHVHRRFERQLNTLANRREEIVGEIRGLQHLSRRAGMAHVKACIVLQSVNVLRNINYIVLCVKTHAQRVTALGGHQQRQDREHVIVQGLQLLLGLLPRCDPQRAALLADEDARRAGVLLTVNWQQRSRSAYSSAGGMLLGGAESVTGSPRVPVQTMVTEAQKRLWILFRMVHLSSALPSELQGQLGSLVEQYLRPIVFEGRVPLEQSLALHDAEGDDTTLRAAAGDEAGGQPNKGTKSQSARDDGGKGGSRLKRQGGNTRGHSYPFSADRAISTSPPQVTEPQQRHSFSGCWPDSAEKLVASRSEIMELLARLPSETLTDADALKNNSIASELLKDLLTSVLVIVQLGNDPPGRSRRMEGLLTDSKYHMMPRRGKTPPKSYTGSTGGRNSRDHAAAVVGFRVGDRAYVLDGIRTSILLQAAVVCPEKGARLRAVEAAVPGRDRGQTGSIHDLREKSPPLTTEGGASGSSSSRDRPACENIEVPLSAVLSEAPEPGSATRLWDTLSDIAPRRFNSASLRERHSSLRRVKASLDTLAAAAAAAASA